MSWTKYETVLWLYGPTLGRGFDMCEIEGSVFAADLTAIDIESSKDPSLLSRMSREPQIYGVNCHSTNSPTTIKAVDPRIFAVYTTTPSTLYVNGDLEP